MRIFVAVLFLFLPILANGATCPAGYYKATPSSECSACPYGHYCPDDDNDNAIKCPDDTSDWNKLLEECGYHPLTKISGIELYSWSGVAGNPYLMAQEITQCVVHKYGVEFQEGLWLLEFGYNPNNGNYWHGCNNLYHFYSANTGYYLADYSATSYEIWYNNIKQCTNKPNHAHYTGSGTPDGNDCPWECDDGYFLHKDRCVMPLCSAGATEFHVGDFVFNIYKDKWTTPAINIGFNDGAMCYVSLVKGLAKGALNVDYNGVIYHTSD